MTLISYIVQADDILLRLREKCFTANSATFRQKTKIGFPTDSELDDDNKADR